MESQLPPPGQVDKPLPVAVPNTSDLRPSYDNMVPSRPKIAPTIPPGFEGTVPTPHRGIPNSLDMAYHVRVALLEQGLMDRNAQLNEAVRANAQLSQLLEAKEAEVFELVRELQHCERRTAKSEIAVEYFAELNVQMAAKIKENKNPNAQVLALKEQLQNLDHNSQKRVLTLETEIQHLKSDKEKLHSKLESSMDTIIALSSAVMRSLKADVSKPKSGTVLHNNLIDLMDNCLVPAQILQAEDHSTTLLGDKDTLDEVEASPTSEKRRALSDSFDSDFSNSSYIVRFKGVRDMAKDDTASSKWAIFHKKDFPVDKDISELDQGHLPNTPSSVDSNSEKDSALSRPISSAGSNHHSGLDSRPLEKYPLPDNNELSAFQTHNKSIFNSSALSEKDSLDQGPIKKSTLKQKEETSPFKNNQLPRAPKIASGEAFPIFRNRAEKDETIRLHKKTAFHDEKTVFPAFFKYGIQFHPAPQDREIYRTVLISNVASGMTLEDLFGQIRGGIVLDAKLISTFKITGTASALITFLEERAALAYRDYSSQHRLSMCGIPLTVTLLTPSWPVRPELRKKISDHQMTRCLEVADFPKNISRKKLTEDLQICPDLIMTWVTFLHLDENRLLELRFSSISQASSAHQMFSSNKKYAQSTVYYVPDPCSQPLETLDVTEPATFVHAQGRVEKVSSEIIEMDKQLLVETKIEEDNPSGKKSWDSVSLQLRDDSIQDTQLVERAPNDPLKGQAICDEYIDKASDELAKSLPQTNLLSIDKITGSVAKAEIGPRPEKATEPEGTNGKNPFAAIQPRYSFDIEFE